MPRWRNTRRLDAKRLGWWAGVGAARLRFTPCRTLTASAPASRVAPVTDWRKLRLHLHRALHEHAHRVPTGYKDSPSSNSAGNLKGRLLLAHGTGDDNVHIRDTVQYIQKLI